MSANRYALAAALVSLTACGGSDAAPVRQAIAAEVGGVEYIVQDTTIDAMLEATGVAEPFAQATLSTKMMGTITAVLVKEGDRVRTGDPLVRIDARDLDARREQIVAGIAGAEAGQREAELGAARMRALFADSAAPRATLDAAEAALARANAAVSAARAGQSELGAMASYAVVRAPFAGVVTQRAVDPGAFAAPGTPLVTVQDASKLRLAVVAPPNAVRALRRGGSVAATIEGVATRATIEGVVPSGGSLYTINAIVPNGDGRFLSGSAAVLLVNEGKRTTRLVPRSAIVREGDLTGVRIKTPNGPIVRWVRLGKESGDFIEVISGLEAGNTVLVPTSRAAGS